MISSKMSSTSWRSQISRRISEVLPRGRDHASRVAHRLEDHPGHRLRVLVDDDVLHLARGEAVALLPAVELAAVVGGREDLEEAGGARLEGRLAGAGAAGGHGPHGGAVIAVVAADELVLPGAAGLAEVLTGELEGRLHRLGAPGEGLDEVEAPGGHRAHALDEVEGDVGGAVHGRREGEALELPRDRLDDARVAVAEGGGVDPGDAVEVAPALHVPAVQALGPGHDQGVLGEGVVVLVVEEGAPQQALVAFAEPHQERRPATRSKLRRMASSTSGRLVFISRLTGPS